MKTKQTGFRSSVFLKRRFRKTWLFIFGIVFLVSCSKDSPTNNEIQNNLNEVPKTTIIEIAQNLFKNSGSINSRVASSNKTIKDIIEHQTHKNQTAFYVINYNEGGFVIIAADDRISPILGFGETGSFSLKASEMPEGVVYWAEEKDNEIQFTIDNKLKQSKDVALLWINVSQSLKSKTKQINYKVPPDDPTYCPDTSITKGPLLTTNWDQWGNGFNNLITLVCPYNPGGKAPTGCVATAMAQIMRYFQKPNTYTWANMPANYGTYDTQLLMKNAGLSVNMNYGCDGSGAYSFDVAPALKNVFGYTNATYADYNYATVKNQIDLNKPVYLSGGNHAWVCDGYNSATFYQKDDNGICTGYAVTTLYFNMNWGWGGASNGYFAFNNFNPPGYNFNSNSKMVYNITP